MSSKNISIDLVYMWVDGNDPKWIEKKQRYMDKKINTVGRYVDNQELKYSLRSVEKNLPWIRKIFIFTDDQIPVFLDISHPKIEIVHHSQIIPNEILPLFNSSLIEYFIYTLNIFVIPLNILILFFIILDLINFLLKNKFINLKDIS